MTAKTKKNIISLESPVTELRGIGPKKAGHFTRLGINVLSDVLDFYPRSYEDLREVRNIRDIKNDEKVLVRAVVLLSRPGRGYGRKRTLHLLVEDKTGRMEVLFFMSGFLKFEAGSEYRFFGKAKVENGRAVMFHPSYSKEDGQEGAIIPVYPLTGGLSQKDLRNLSRKALEFEADIPETLPRGVVDDANICGIGYAIRNIHYPEDDDKYKEARYRLVYEELFSFKTLMALSKSRGGQGRNGNPMRGNFALDFVSRLPYKLTGAQRRALEEVLADMAKPVAMNRLIQGDVGSGKTVIAEAALVQAVRNGFQGAFMAPTEILATQHFETLKADLAPLGINVGLLTGSMSFKDKRLVTEGLKNGEIDIAVGTHALISKDIEYDDLGIVITDEQHRFGVLQRKNLSEKGCNPDILVMTATPIPRTLAVVLYADLDVSVIDELPPGRIPVVTKKFTQKNRDDAYKLLLEQIAEGRQAYVVAPLIEESESISGYSAEDLFDEFSRKYPDISCDLLHGQMPQKEKDEIMSRFYRARTQVLISTLVIEVGINVPNASVMLIENQERFGLSQLHQLRGRVGRGKYQSYCLLVSGEESEMALQRADIMCEYPDGFIIAEKDLEMRGPGEFFGYRQHGLPQLKLADPLRHMKIADEAGRAVDKLLADDPDLSKAENICFANRLKEKYINIDGIIL